MDGFNPRQAGNLGNLIGTHVHRDTIVSALGSVNDLAADFPASQSRKNLSLSLIQLLNNLLNLMRRLRTDLDWLFLRKNRS